MVSVYPAQGSPEDVRNWILECLLINLPRPVRVRPVNTEQLRLELSEVTFHPQYFIDCSVHVATKQLRNWRYAAYSIVMLPETPENLQNQLEAWDLIVCFLFISIILIISSKSNFYLREKSTQGKRWISTLDT